MDLATLVSDLEAIALKNSIDRDNDSWISYIHRFYSRTFSTPLMQVYDLPLDHVIQSYFEEVFDNMPEEEKDKVLLEMFKDPEKAQQDAEIDEIAMDELEKSILWKTALKRQQKRAEKSKKKAIKIPPPKPPSPTKVPSLIGDDLDGEIDMDFSGNDL